MMCGVLGVSDVAARRHAIDLGMAMQLTNICRDVLEDRERGRVYVPAEWLGEDPDRAMPAAVQQLLALADRYYASADRGLGYLEPRSALAVRTARLVYAEIGREKLRTYINATIGFEESRVKINSRLRQGLHVGCIISEIPCVDKIPVEQLKTGIRVVVDGEQATVEVLD